MHIHFVENEWTECWVRLQYDQRCVCVLQKLIMQKAAEDLRSEAKAKAEEKERYINDRVAPLKAEGLGQGNFVFLIH